MLRRRLPLVLLLLAGALPAYADAAPADPAAALGPWAPVAGAPAARGLRGAAVQTRPRRFEAFTLNRAALEPRLRAAPLEGTRAARRRATVVSIPAPDGTLQRFTAVDSPVMEPGLARRHPEIVGTFAGVGIDDPTATARFDLTALGFHASVRSAKGAWYVDPYYRGDDVTHVSYFGRRLSNVHGPLVDQVTRTAARRTGARAAPPGPGETVIQRTYRLAFATDPVYATYFGGAGNVASANATLINRVNQVYNDDVAIKLVLIANNDALNFDTVTEFNGPLGPCAPLPCYSPTAPPPLPQGQTECSAGRLVENQLAIDTIIGDANYDIGHIGFGGGSGGIAGLGVVGQSGIKAEGCTGLPTPQGDYYAIDYVAHEMGHQFGGNHTFNGSGGSCSGNENEDTAVEPGSGSSIQAYAGICDTDDLQPHSDPYFSQTSIDEIQAYVNSEIGGEEEEGTTIVATANHNPVVTPPAARTIPVRTPFTLTGSATDQETGQSLIYLWEQSNAGPAKELLSNNKPDGPLFRVFSSIANVSATDTLLSPSPGQNTSTATDFSRTFPDAAQVAADNTNAGTGSCPPPSTPPTPGQIDCYSEFLPTSARTLDFRLTARDRFAAGGGVTIADTAITVAGTTPFRITTPAVAATLPGLTNLPVEWSVAGTDQAPFGVPTVRILYSTDGGLTFPTVLAASTANDGSDTVTLPNVATTLGRIKVEAIGNYFFDVSRGNLTVTAGGSVTPTVSPDPYVIDRVEPGLAVRVSPKRDRRKPFRFRATGRLRLPESVDERDGCAGRVRIVTTFKGEKVRSKTKRVRSNCRFAARANFRSAKKLGAKRGRLRFRFRFAGNERLEPTRVVKKVKFGRS